MAYKYQRSAPYQPGQSAPYRLSRSKIELFMQCPRCFWLDARLKITRPSGPPFNINKAIDELFKKEFDHYRALQKPHPIMSSNQVNAVPFHHNDLNKWRTNFTGWHTPTRASATRTWPAPSRISTRLSSRFLPTLRAASALSSATYSVAGFRWL